MKPIDWHNIRDKGNGFEELGVRLVLSEEPPAAKFIRQDIHDGINCYWEFQDGSKWGWQFKYFVDSFGATQWDQIGKDIKTALKKHPELTRYYVCTPRNLTLNMNEDWERHVAEWKVLAKSETERKVEFIWWGDSELIRKLFEFNKHDLLKDFFDIHRESLFTTPGPLADFIASIADFDEVKSVLDPVCGSGSLLRKVADKTGAKSIYGIDRDPFFIEIARRLFSSGEPNLIQGDAFAKHEEFPDVFDLIVAHPPFGVRLTNDMTFSSPDMKFVKTLDVALTLRVLDQLTKNGKALIIVPSNFFSNYNAKGIQQVVIDKGFRIRAAIYIPERTFHWTALGSYLIVLERGSQGQMFVGEFQNDPLHQKKLLKNLQNHKAGSRLGLGTLCDLGSFKRFENLASRGLLLRLAKERDWNCWSAKELISEQQLLDHGRTESVQYGPNSCFLQTIGKFRASTDLESLTGGTLKSSSSVVHLQVNPELVNPRYLAQWFNESPVGRATLATITSDSTFTSGSTFQTISSRDIMELEFYLPPLEDQRKAVESFAELRRIRAVTDELESSLWDGKSDFHDIVRGIESINQNSEGGYKDWLETLPYPLASILWRHYATSHESHHERTEALLHFFEATTEFITTVHISAFMSDDELWEETQRRFIEKKNWELQKASFGTWVMALEYLSKRCGVLLSNLKESELLRKIYGTSNMKVISMLSDPKLVDVLRQAKDKRNERFHKGFMGKSALTQMHSELQEFVSEVRGIFRRLWLEFKLIQPGDSADLEGIYDIKTELLMGIRTPFKDTRLKFKSSLAKGKLYLADSTNQSALRLEPFLILKRLPRPVCYFFNEINEKKEYHFVSYDSEEESNICSDVIAGTFSRIYLSEESS